MKHKFYPFNEAPTSADCFKCGETIDDPYTCMALTVTTWEGCPGIQYLCAECSVEFARWMYPNAMKDPQIVAETDQFLAHIRDRKKRSP